MHRGVAPAQIHLQLVVRAQEPIAAVRRRNIAVLLLMLLLNHMQTLLSLLLRRWYTFAG